MNIAYIILVDPKYNFSIISPQERLTTSLKTIGKIHLLLTKPNLVKPRPMPI